MAKAGDQQTQNQVQNSNQNQTQNQSGTQSSVSNPWETAQPLLKSLIDQYSGLNVGVTGDQSSALAGLRKSADMVPNFGAAGSDAVNKFFNSSTDPQIGMLSSALSQLQGNIGGTASGAELDPYKTPGFSDAISTMTNDITNKVKGVYAGSGRDPSGAGSFAKSLGRGLTEGIAPVVAGQFNTNNTNRLNAANTLYGAGNTTAGAITGQQQIPLANSAQGMNLAGMLSSLFTAPDQLKLAAANASQQQPFGNLAALLNPATQLAGLGGSTTGNTSGTGTSTGTSAGTSKTTTEQQQSMLSNIMGGASSAIGLLSFLSDARAKENIERVGKLDDGQPVFRYNYKGRPGTQIGLLAQNVLEVEPDAVEPFGDTGLLAVNYKTATDQAARMAA